MERLSPRLSTKGGCAVTEASYVGTRGFGSALGTARWKGLPDLLWPSRVNHVPNLIT